jgi:hypothetical protein
MLRETRNRRRCERSPGSGATATTSASGREPCTVVVFDLSCGGIALDCNWQFPAEAQVRVELPEAGGAIDARVVRGDGARLALVFRQDVENLARVDRALVRFDAMAKAA